MSSDGPRLSTAQRVGVAGVCLLALAGSCLLAWWQWTRFESSGGSIQNFGYMLQWPLFGLFPAFLVWRIRKLARKPDTPQEPQEPESQQRQAPRRKLGYVAPTVSGSGQPQDPTLAEYNRYLAELNEHAEGRS